MKKYFVHKTTIPILGPIHLIIIKNSMYDYTLGDKKNYINQPLQRLPCFSGKVQIINLFFHLVILKATIRNPRLKQTRP